MTTTVTVKAHCPAAVEVHVTTTDRGNPVGLEILQDGQLFETYAYADRVISIKEVTK
jgi:hypothetical protein